MPPRARSVCAAPRRPPCGAGPRVMAGRDLTPADLPSRGVPRTYPRELLPSEVKSRGEEKVFQALRAALDDDWEVFHSASWVARDPGEGALDGEIDFVLCHRERAIVCLE